MGKKKIGPAIILASFLIIICLWWLLWLVFGKFTDSTSYENRYMAAMPELTTDTYATFTKEFDEYFNDAIPFRNNLIELNSAIDYYFLNRSSNDSVVIGKDNWLFLKDEETSFDPISAYNGTNLYTDDELKAIVNNLLHQRDILKDQGVEFVLFIAPNKSHVYYDKMPDEYGPPADMYAAKQLVTYLKENTDLRVVYPCEELINARKKVDENMYYLTDTHWTEVGAYVGAGSLLKELGIDIPPVEEVKIEKTEDNDGDLAGMLNLTRQMRSKDPRYAVSGYDTHNMQLTNDEMLEVISYKAQNADPRRIYMYRDSFFTAMRSVLGAQFNDSHFVHYYAYSYEDYSEYNPDIFVYEVVERQMERLKYFSVQ